MRRKGDDAECDDDAEQDGIHYQFFVPSHFRPGALPAMAATMPLGSAHLDARFVGLVSHTPDRCQTVFEAPAVPPSPWLRVHSARRRRGVWRRRGRWLVTLEVLQIVPFAGA